MRLPVYPPSYMDVLLHESTPLATLLGLRAGPAPGGKYRHWDTLRHVPPPEGLTSEQWWAAIKIARRQLRRDVPLTDKAGLPFAYTSPDPVLSYLHQIDRDASGNIEVSEEVTNPATRDRYIVNSLIEEAITSSQLEGASTTSQVARNMLRSGRKPIDRSERMILNNYLGMSHIRELHTEPFSRAHILGLHRLLTHGTLDVADGAGRLRREHEDIFVGDNTTGERLFEPLHASRLEARMDALCAFANAANDQGFVHPVIRAIIVHFWLAYDHPFVDGNGRTARALFYWSMLRSGYWLFQYVSISHILHKAPARYARSYLYTATDENDLTYFILYQLGTIQRAIRELHDYLAKKITEVRSAERLFANTADLNHRQFALLSHALRHPHATYTIDSHQRSHSVSYQTARTDLLSLESRGLLEKRKRGKSFVFTNSPALLDSTPTV